ncbi:MAG: cytochrome c3 family protein [Thermoanaerobaculia bacterium]|nr:MAG: cytochrome c3 family protein [Thermoanaerobaculia bacterium]MBZ0101934.1 cytochrome c family protein [Thermoanaerobaculia bacterium]
MKKLGFVWGALALLAVFATSAGFAATAKEAPATVTIDDCVVKKAAVEFPHGTHAEKIACNACHHTQENLKADSTEEVATCASCHTAPEKAETPKCSEMSLTKNPFHLGCVNCHKEEVKKDATIKAPTKCDDCHPKG